MEKCLPMCRERPFNFLLILILFCWHLIILKSNIWASISPSLTLNLTRQSTKTEVGSRILQEGKPFLHSFIYYFTMYYIICKSIYCILSTRKINFVLKAPFLKITLLVDPTMPVLPMRTWRNNNLTFTECLIYARHCYSCLRVLIFTPI